jgi:hypothetical protein
MQTVVGSEQLLSFCKRFQARAGQIPSRLGYQCIEGQRCRGVRQSRIALSIEELVDTFLPRDFRRVAAAFLYFD